MMVKKSVISGEYIIQQNNNRSIEVYRIYDNVKEGLREVAMKHNIAYDKSACTRTLGKLIIKEIGDGQMADTGEYVIKVRKDGGIDIYRKFANVKDALRKISESIGYEYDTKWTTQQLGNKLIDLLLKQ